MWAEVFCECEGVMTSGTMRRKLVFHIGHQKTGTTTIQNALAASRVRVEGARILYPARMAHNYLKNHVLRYAQDGAVMEGRAGMPGLTAISQELAAGGYDFAVFSGEAFADFDPALLRRALDRFFLPHVTDHTVLCYVRPHAARVLSSFAEQTKIGMHSGSLQEFHEKALKKGRFKYAIKLSPWVQAFGERFVVRPMVRQELEQGSVLHDFARHAFGPDMHVDIQDDIDANESLCVEDLMVLKIVQGVIGKRSKNTRLELGWAIAKLLSDDQGGAGKKTKLKLHRALAERIRSDYRSDAKRTDLSFFGGKPVLQQELDRAVDESAAEAVSVEPSDHLSTAMIRNTKALASLVNDMLDRQPQGWSAFFLDRRAEGVA